VLVAVALVLGTASAFAQTQVRFVEYSAKFLCGVSDGKEAGSAAVRPGTYETTINIHNPQLPTNPLPFVVFAKKAVLAPPEGEKPIPPSNFAWTGCRLILPSRLTARSSATCWGLLGQRPSLKAFWCSTL
jgi:hypothetical protein